MPSNEEPVIGPDGEILGYLTHIPGDMSFENMRIEMKNAEAEVLRAKATLADAEAKLKHLRAEFHQWIVDRKHHGFDPVVPPTLEETVAKSAPSRRSSGRPPDESTRLLARMECDIEQGVYTLDGLLNENAKRLVARYKAKSVSTVNKVRARLRFGRGIRSK